MAGDLLLIVVGLAVVLISGDLLVRGAVGIATAFRIPALVVSLTIVAFGTSAPEMFVSALAVSGGNAGIALGDIMGANIANALLVLGVPALIFPIAVKSPGLRLHAAALCAATAAFLAVAWFNGAIDRPTGAMLFAGILLYVALLWFRAARGDTDDPVIDSVDDYCDNKAINAQTLLFVLGGLVGLPLGANLLVENGVDLAERLAVRQAVIGLTIVAIGTSLPELATVAAAAIRKRTDVAMGSVVGSCIFNLLAVGGVAGLFGKAAFDQQAFTHELPALVAATALIAGYIFLKRNIGGLAGALMCAAYAAILADFIFDLF